MTERGQAEAGAALHVVDAGTVKIAVPLLQLQLALQGPVRVHRIQMRHDQNARPVAAPGRPCDDAIAEPVAARPALNLHAEARHGGFGHVHDPIDGDAVFRGRLDGGPSLDIGQDFGRVDFRQIALAAHGRASWPMVA